MRPRTPARKPNTFLERFRRSISRARSASLITLKESEVEDKTSVASEEEQSSRRSKSRGRSRSVKRRRRRRRRKSAKEDKSEERVRRRDKSEERVSSEEMIEDERVLSEEMIEDPAHETHDKIDKSEEKAKEESDDRNWSLTPIRRRRKESVKPEVEDPTGSVGSPQASTMWTQQTVATDMHTSSSSNLRSLKYELKRTSVEQIAEFDREIGSDDSGQVSANKKKIESLELKRREQEAIKDDGRYVPKISNSAKMKKSAVAEELEKAKEDKAKENRAKEDRQFRNLKERGRTA